MSATSRRTVRDALSALLQTALVGTGLPCQAVYGYLKGTFNGESPVVIVSSSGTLRQKQSYQETRPLFHLTVWSFVLYSDTAANYTEHDAENLLDDLERRICDVLDTNQQTATWFDATYAKLSQIDTVLIGGAGYRRERIEVVVECAQ